MQENHYKQSQIQQEIGERLPTFDRSIWGQFLVRFAGRKNFSSKNSRSSDLKAFQELEEGNCP